jgi:hypothetical protein
MKVAREGDLATLATLPKEEELQDLDSRARAEGGQGGQFSLPGHLPPELATLATFRGDHGPRT